MRLIIRRKDWLRNRVVSKLKEDHSELFEPHLISNLKRYSFDKNRWWLILILVISIFIVGGVVDINALNFLEIDSETAKILIDRRAANIASITAITLVVVGFLINNLAVKEAFAYQILFKHSHLYPIIYFTLSTIGCFFIVSTLRDQLESSQFVNIVLAGTYLTLIILFLIGYLFKTIIDFTDNRTIMKLLHEELLLEATYNLKVSLIKTKSNSVFREIVAGKGAVEFDILRDLDLSKATILDNPNTDDKEQIYRKKRRLYDINLRRVSKFIDKKKKETKRVVFSNMALESTISEYDNFITSEEANTPRGRSQLRKSLTLSNIKKPRNSVRKYFDDKLEKLVEENDHRSLEGLMDSYLAVYKLQMKHQK